MHVFEIVSPGYALRYDNPEPANSNRIILEMMKSQFKYAVIALNLLEIENQKSEEEQALRQELEPKYARVEGENSYEELLDAKRKTEIELKRHQWSLGKVPLDYREHVKHIYGHAYIYALDSFSKLLDKLCDRSDAPSDIAVERGRFEVALPSLKEIRDSAHHIEDRGRKRGRKEKPIDTQILVIDVRTSDNEFSYTAENGSHPSIAVSFENTEMIESVLQHVINAFEWTGPPRVEVY